MKKKVTLFIVAFLLAACSSVEQSQDSTPTKSGTPSSSETATETAEESGASQVTTKNNIKIPTEAENSNHGYLLADDRIPRLYSCEEWEEFWFGEGPAISFEVAEKKRDQNLEVSTQIYIKNEHLDSNKDGVICYEESQETSSISNEDEIDRLDTEKSNNEEITQPSNQESDKNSKKVKVFSDIDNDWKKSVDQVRSALRQQNTNNYPLDFAVSPNVKKSYSDAVKRSVRLALRFWGPYINSTRPLAVTVIHKDDKDWFLQRWEELGRDNTGEYWWNLTKGGGGGAVGTTESGIPNMYFKTLDGDAPPGELVDYYVHEVTHFYQMLNIGNRTTPCWYAEGSANFIGFSLSYPNDSNKTIQYFSAVRKDRLNILSQYYSKNGGISKANIINDTLNFPENDDRCQHVFPQLGYNLGMFITEKFILDFGFQDFVNMTDGLSSYSLAESFERATGKNYIEWVNNELAEYLVTLIKN